MWTQHAKYFKLNYCIHQNFDKKMKLNRCQVKNFKKSKKFVFKIFNLKCINDNDNLKLFTLRNLKNQNIYEYYQNLLSLFFWALTQFFVTVVKLDLRSFSGAQLRFCEYFFWVNQSIFFGSFFQHFVSFIGLWIIS